MLYAHVFNADDDACVCRDNRRTTSLFARARDLCDWGIESDRDINGTPCLKDISRSDDQGDCFACHESGF